ncbi:MAG: hypothetical protein JWO31_1014, partial [Phycisphaerales bacterium]|nr:hypothetical protein [Phycisphaerales bacterium]
MRHDLRNRHRRRTRAAGRTRRRFHLSDLCVGLAAAALLFGAVIPHLAYRLGNNGGNRTKCASNLRQIAMAAIIYAGADARNNGKFPRTRWDRDAAAAGPPALYTGTDSRQSFADPTGPDDPAVPRANDVTAALYLLFKTSDLTAEVFNCPASDAPRFDGDVAAHANWPGGPRHLSYSYSNPYPTPAAAAAGWKFDTTLGPDYPIAADMNYGDNPNGGPTRVRFDADRKSMASANSANHWFDGQQVAYVDAHVEWNSTAFCGAPRPGRN